MRLVKGRDLEVYVDEYSSFKWYTNFTEDTDTSISIYGYAILYAAYTLLHKSQRQIECALSSTEKKYTRLSYALHNAILVTGLLIYLKEKGLPIDTSTTKKNWNVFEYNSGAIMIKKSQI